MSINNLSIVNDPPRTLKGPGLLHNLLSFEQYSEFCALDFTSNGNRQKYTYRQLHSCIQVSKQQIEETLSSTFNAEQPSQQHIIPVLLPQAPCLYISQIAILESGGAFCPLNLESPQERIKFVVGDVQATVLITTSEFKDIATWEHGPTVIVVDEFPTIPDEIAVSNTPSREATPQELAYVMYTSGSTGLPKGVAVSHLAVTQSLFAHQRYIPEFKRFLQFAAPSFDVSVFEIFFPLIRGCTLVGCNRSQLLNDLPGMLNGLEVDACELTPTVVGSLLQKRSYVPGLKLLLTIGELLTRPIVEEFGGSETKDSMLWGMYGPTEAAIHCHIHPNMRANAKPGNIGVPLDTVSSFIAAPGTPENVAELVILPVGDLGELVLGGPQLADGYLNRPDQNRAAFITFEGRDYYRSGDKGRQLEDGSIEILGRISAGQVKLRGQRVELGEIEEVVYKHPGIKTVCAVVLGSVLVVFALVEDSKMKPQDVLATCSKWLPTYMVPSEIVLLQNFSYLPSGKVDKKKLQADFQKQREADDNENSDSGSEAYKKVKEAVYEVLGKFPASMRLAAVGLDSLIAIRAASKLRLAGFNITTVAVLQAETLDALGKLCESSSSFTTAPISKPIEIDRAKAIAELDLNADEVENIIKCTPLQSAMLSETAVDEKAYRNWAEIELCDQSGAATVVSAIHVLAAQNAILRTGFIDSSESDGYSQIIWKRFPESDIEIVQRLDYTFNSSKDKSLQHPIRIQLQQTSSSIKLLVHLHHALYDAWSLELLFDDLDSILANKQLTPRPSFDLLVNGYLDGTLITDSWVSKDYWKDHLAYLNLRQVPNFHSKRTSISGLAVTSLMTSIPTSDLETAARNLSASPQSLFQAAYALVMSTYLGSSDLCFGTVFSGRTLPIPGIEDIAGPCLSTLPIRVDVSTSATFQDLVQDLNLINRKHLDHSAVPLREIKSTSGVNPRQSLFDTMVIWQQTLQSYDHTRKYVRLVKSVDNLEFNLTLEVIPGTGNIELKANYQTSLLPKSQVDLLLRQIEQIALLGLRSENTPLNDIFRHLDNKLLSIENEAAAAPLGSETLASTVERIAAEDPNRPAIDFAISINESSADIQHMSYGELNARANQLAHFLLEHHVIPDDLICLCMEKNVDLYASILSTIKAGAAYLPVLPDIPAERLRHILEEANVKIIFAMSISRPLFRGLHNITVVYLDELDLSSLPISNLPSKFQPDNLCYAVFTSGSTGTPKGVLVTQGNLLTNLDTLETIYPTTKKTRFLQSCSHSFDVSVFEIFFTWRVGACLCATVKDVLYRDIENVIRVLDVTHLSLTPTVASLVDPVNVTKVEFLVVAGEALTQKVFNSWTGKGLFQGYGPSENTNICTLLPELTADDFCQNIGPPLRNVSAFVLAPGPDFAVLPWGGEGEFCFGGTQVCRGYMNPNQEAGIIINHPEFGRLYRSGDFGRLMPDGSLAYTGRKDDQVKIRGQRVELGEISSVLIKSPEVHDCITMVINPDSDQSRLVCFWTSPTGASGSLESIKQDPAVISKLYAHLQASLPSYMIPSALIPVSYLPPTSHGKVDKRSLISHYHTLDSKYLESIGPAAPTSSDHSWTELELQIRELLAQVTKIPAEKLDPETSFFNIGVDSISAISFSKNLRHTTKLQVEISDVLKFPSIVRLAERLSTKTPAIDPVPNTGEDVAKFDFDQAFVDSTSKDFNLAGKSVQHIFPCTPLQEAMLSAAESSSEKLYSNHVILKVTGDVDKLEKCWQQMVQRHEILRTCFVSTEMPQYPYVQVVLEKHDFLFQAEDESRLHAETRLDVFEPPYTLILAKSTGITKLSIAMHHALYDGAALAIIYEEVEKLFRDQPLPPAISFAPFLRSMASVDPNESDKFWDSVLGGCSPTAIKKISHEKNTTRIQRIRSTCPLHWVERNAMKHSTTLLALFHSVWASLISERLQESDICFGNVVGGRNLSVHGIERLVAPCFNTIPSRLQNVHKLSYLEAFRQLQHLNADSMPFQLTPLRRLQAKFSPDGSRLFDTLFILQQQPRELDSSIWSILEDDGAMDFPLVCEIVPKHCQDSLEIILHSHSSIISEENAQSILHSFDEHLRMALENPRRQLLSSSTKELISAKAIAREATKSESAAEGSTSKAMTPEELQLRDVISNFSDIQIEKINRDVSIFRLGLDSISTVQVAARLRKLGHNVMASDILEHPSIAQLSIHLISKQSVTSPQIREFDFASFDSAYRLKVCSKYNIDLNSAEKTRPCTTVQQGMIAQSLHSNGDEYVNSMWLELHPGTSISAFKSAWTAAMDKHDMLRTGFVQTGDQKHPFAMITYARSSVKLPFSEAPDQDIKSSIMDKLAQCPWSLSAIHDGATSRVRFTAHHALYDAQSLQMILSDVGKSCNSLPLTEPVPVGSLLGAILVDAEDTEAQKSFWLGEENKVIVNKFPELTPLRVSKATSHVLELTSETSTSGLEDACRQSGVTVQAAGQAAWARLLAAYIGEVSTTFGMTLSGRSIQENADAIAFPSIVTLPVRCDVVGTNEELLARTMQSTAALHKHQFTPLTSIQKWCGFPEGKIFDTLFAYQKLPSSAEDVDLPWDVVQEEASVDYAVSMEIQPTKSGQLTLRLTFRDDLVPIEHATLLLRQYDALLLDTVRNPKASCDLAPTTGNDLLSITPAKESALPDSVTLLHEFVERGAEEWPKKIAFEFATCLEPLQSKIWTFQQLDQEANKIANLLLKHNVGPGQIVAICFDKCPEASFAIVGILKAGCSYVALDPTAPNDRLSFIMSDSGANLVLTAGKPTEKMSAMNVKVLALDEPCVLHGCTSEKPTISRDIDPQDTSYCLYTSGTTGTPKGCLITHENAVQAMLSFQRLFAGHWTSESKWLQFASFHFDVSVLELFWSWSVGICVASAPRDLIFEDIPGAIQNLGIAHIDLTPSLARLLHPDDVPTLCKGVFITGGESLKQEILDVWGEKACIYNGYGPTEATIGVTMYPRVPTNGKPANIGPAFDNVGSFVLKPGTELPVLRGAVGELVVSGKLVGKGYLNRPDLTAAKFPTLKAFNERVYLTGDLVRILHDGSIIFLGRADDQVKLRGQRLELSEINEVIKKSDESIEEIVTLVLKHTAQQKEQLVTFFVYSSGDEAAAVERIPWIRDACKARLPGYMVPTHFVPIKALPLSPNNKADSKQLAAMYNALTVEDLQRIGQSSQQDKSWSNNERKIIQTLARIMNIDATALTRGSNIFELGMDSISIIGFSRGLQNAGLENAKLSIVKSNPNIGALVHALLDEKTLDQGVETAYIFAAQNIAAFSQKHLVGVCKDLGIHSKDVESLALCTPVQEGMIYRFLESDHPIYFNRFQFLLDHSVEPAKLLRAWNVIVAKLQILRTQFVETDDGYAQVVLREMYVDLTSTSTNYDTTEKASALKTPYSIFVSPSNSGNLLSLQIFHGLYDGNSLSILLRRFIDEYRGIENANFGPSFHSSLPYGPLAQIPGASDFWTKHLENWSYSPLPEPFESPKDTVFSRNINALDGFETLRKQFGVTPQAMIQAAWLSVLQTISNSEMTIGVVTSGRAIDLEGAEDIIGPLFNTVPFHVRIEAGMTSTALITQCHEFNMQMQDFQHTPLKDIQKWSPAKPGQSLFDSLFVFQRSAPDEDSFAHGVWTQVEDEQVADYPLAFEATLAVDGKLGITIVARGSILSPSAAASLVDQVEKALISIIKSNGTDIIATTTTTAEQSTNGVNGTSQVPIVHLNGIVFIWTQTALIIRKEIASLTKSDEDSIQATSSIFELGLDSIDVIKLASRLKKQGIEIPVSAIIKSQTIANMLPRIAVKSKSLKNGAGPSAVKTMSQDLRTYLSKQGKLPEDVVDVLPATPLQQSMVNEMTNSGHHRYFNVEAFELHASIEAQRLKSAVEHVIASSPILRTSFVSVDDPKSPVSFAQLLNKSIPGITSSKELNLDKFVDEFTSKTRKLAASTGRLLYVHFLSVSGKNYMVMAISHALYDGTSLRSLHADIQNAYIGTLLPRPDFLPFLEDVFKSTTEDAKTFWKSALSNLPSAQFPRKKDNSSTSTVHRLERTSSISLAEIEKLCKSLQISLQTLGQTCWTLVLAHLMGQLDVVFGSILSCRDSEEASEVMFPLMNTVAVRAVLHGSLRDMLKYMQDMSDTTRQFQHFPLGTAQAYALVSRDSHSLKDTTLFDTLFIYQGRRQSPSKKVLYESVSGSAEVEFPVCVEMEILEDKHLSWTTACKSIARDSRETENLVTMLDLVLQRLIDAPQEPTIVSSADGISVCGLPSFRKIASSDKPVFHSPLKLDDETWSETELSIRKALVEISGSPEEVIRKDTTIFHLGLDSILVLKLPVLLKTYGIKLAVSTILREQTVFAMAKAAEDVSSEQKSILDVEAVLSRAISALDVPATVSEVGEIQSQMPVTAGQLYMIRAWQSSQGVLLYPSFAYTLQGQLNKMNLESAWAALLQRHQILRTGFTEIGTEVIQTVFKNPSNTVVYTTDLSSVSASPDISFPPLKLVVETNTTTNTKFKLLIHHALYDGISLPLLLADLQSLYLAHPLTNPTPSFGPFVAQSISTQTTREKWTSYLSSTIFSPQPTITTTSPTRTEVFHPSRAIKPLDARARAEGLTTDALLLASIAKLYAQRISSSSSASSNSDIVLGIYLSNRALASQSLAAPTLNLLPLHITNPVSRPLTAIAHDIQRDLLLLGDSSMAGASLAQIYEWTGVRVDFFVNILKPALSSTADSGVEELFIPTQEFPKRAAVVSDLVIPGIEMREGGEAYLPSIDAEVRYLGDSVDVGVFAPEHMLGVQAAEEFVEEFVKAWS